MTKCLSSRRSKEYAVHCNQILPHNEMQQCLTMFYGASMCIWFFRFFTAYCVVVSLIYRYSVVLQCFAMLYTVFGNFRCVLSYFAAYCVVVKPWFALFADVWELLRCFTVFCWFWGMFAMFTVFYGVFNVCCYVL